MLFSSILLNFAPSGVGGGTVRNQKVEFDQPSFLLTQSFSFYDCELSMAPGTGALVLLEAEQLVRFENCTLKASIAVFGKGGSTGYAPLEENGPSIFFDNCVGENFQASLSTGNGPMVSWTPKIQITGFTSHVRVHTTGPASLEISFSQVRFSMLEIIGSVKSIQFVAYIGRQLFLKNIKFDFIWIRESFIEQVPFVDIDDASVKNISKWLKTLNSQHGDLLRSVETLLEVLRRSKNGKSFLMLNDALCSYLSTISRKSACKNGYKIIIYGFFRNFYSVRPWIFLSALIIIVFSFAFIFIDTDVHCLGALQNSIFAFSGNPTNDSK